MSKLDQEIQSARDAIYDKESLAYKYGIGLVEANIKSAMRLYKIITALKIILALLIMLSVFLFPGASLGFVTLGVLFCLISPFGFFKDFIQQLIEYNTKLAEGKQELNALESNKHFDDIYRKLSKLNKN